MEMPSICSLSESSKVVYSCTASDPSFTPIDNNMPYPLPSRCCHRNDTVLFANRKSIWPTRLIRTLPIPRGDTDHAVSNNITPILPSGEDDQLCESQPPHFRASSRTQWTPAMPQAASLSLLAPIPGAHHRPADCLTNHLCPPKCALQSC